MPINTHSLPFLPTTPLSSPSSPPVFLPFFPPSTGAVLNYSGLSSLTPAEVAASASRMLRFFDLGGHQRFSKTLLHGLTAMLPDHVLLCVSAVAGGQGKAEGCVRSEGVRGGEGCLRRRLGWGGEAAGLVVLLGCWVG